MAGSTAIYFTSLTGCATLPDETREDVANIQWDCNPILQIPPKGAYTGTNGQGSLPFSSQRKTRKDGTSYYVSKRASEKRNVNQVISNFIKYYGIKPTFHAGGHGVYSAHNAYFPLETCKAAIEWGVLPVIRYVLLPHEGYKPVAKGVSDDNIKRFAHKAAEFGEPVVLLPWQCVNEPYWDGQVWKWSRGDSGEYKEAWVRMHDIFEKEGANKYIVWSTKMIAGGFGPQNPALDWAAYTPPKEYVDIIGWNCNSNIGRFGRQFDASVTFYRQFHRDDVEAVERYPTKPQMFWELIAYRSPGQASWINKALTMIQETYFWVKAVMFDVRYSPAGGYDPTHTIETQEVIRKHFTSGYFIGSAFS